MGARAMHGKKGAILTGGCVQVVVRPLEGQRRSRSANIGVVCRGLWPQCRSVMCRPPGRFLASWRQLLHSPSSTVRRAGLTGPSVCRLRARSLGRWSKVSVMRPGGWALPNDSAIWTSQRTIGFAG